MLAVKVTFCPISAVCDKGVTITDQLPEPPLLAKTSSEVKTNIERAVITTVLPFT